MFVYYCNTNCIENITGGDQKTASRIKGCQRIRSNAERGKDKLKGFVPVIEDWHAKMCLMEVCCTILHNS